MACTGLLRGPDDLPVMEMQQTDKMLKTDDLLLNCTEWFAGPQNQHNASGQHLYSPG